MDEFEVGQGRVTVQIGRYHTVQEFVQKARELEHPFDGYECLQDDLRRAISNL